MNEQRGFTLIELAVAILILSIGSIAVMRSLDQAQVSAAGAEDRALAQIIVRNRAEELRLLGPYAQLPGTEAMARREFTITVTRETTAAGLIEATIAAQATTRSGAGAVLVTYLPMHGGL